MPGKPKDPFGCYVYFKVSAPELLPWYETRSWRLSREWLNAHTGLITPAAASALALLGVADSVRTSAEAAIDDELLLHARLLESSLGENVDAAYRALIGDEAFHEPNAPDHAELMRLMREWMNTPNWGESKAYLGIHHTIICDEAAALMQMSITTLPDEEDRAIARDHLKILRLVREYGIFEGYQRFVREYWGS